MKVIKVGLFLFLFHSPSITSLKGNIIPIKCLAYNNSFTFIWIWCYWEQNSGPVNLICYIQISLTLSHSYFLINLARKWVIFFFSGKSCITKSSTIREEKKVWKKLKTTGKEGMKLAGKLLAPWVQCSGFFFPIPASFPGISCLFQDSFGIECAYILELSPFLHFLSS